MILRSHIEGPRWAKIERLLRLLSIKYKLDIEISLVKGWITEDVFFRVEGDWEGVTSFMTDLRKSVDEYNR